MEATGGGALATEKKATRGLMEGFTPASPPRIFWNSRKRPAYGRSSEKAITEERLIKAQEEPTSGGGNPRESPDVTDGDTAMDTEAAAAEGPTAGLSERRKALFEPLEPAGGGPRMFNEALPPPPPPPDFETASYPKGWLVGKKRKLVNVDVVESMRRIAVQEMNRKDREIDGLNEQLEEDARCVEHLQVQLLEERRKRAEAERENAVLQNQITLLVDMLQDADGDGEDMGAPPEHC